MSEFRWKGYLMGAVVVDDHRAIHLWSPGVATGSNQTASLCGRMQWFRDAIDKHVATGWPDCNDCVNEAFKRLVTAGESA